MTASVYSSSRAGGQPHLRDITVVTHTGERIPGLDLVQKHRVVDLLVVPAEPGYPGLAFTGAVFEYEREGGHLYFDIGDVTTKLGLKGPQANGTKWFHKRRANWATEILRWGGSDKCIRPSQ
eukprot:4507000-Pyramimonas_sp.AAC.1